MTDRLPTFIIGGAPRSGTNFLCHALDRHPDVYLAKPYMPEPKIFMGPRRPRAEYLARYAGLFASAGSRRALGEKTTYYLENAQSLALIEEHLPAVRVMFLVREPVARAYSNYLWTKKNRLETLSFEDALAAGERPSPLPADRDYARPFDYVQRGQYDIFAERYLRRLGRDRVAFFLYEDLVLEPARVLDDIQVFIGVPRRDLRAEDLGLINSARETAPPIRPATEARLRRYFSPSVRRFQALTGLDVSAWGYA